MRDPRTSKDNLSNCLFQIPENIQVSPTGLEPMIFAMPASAMLDHEATQLGTGQFVGFICFRERLDE